MATTEFTHKFEVNQSVYFKTDHGVNKGLIVKIFFQKERSASDGQLIDHVNYGILKGAQQQTINSQLVFATPEEAFK